jgi:hypothetical protein
MPMRYGLPPCEHMMRKPQTCARSQMLAPSLLYYGRHGVKAASRNALRFNVLRRGRTNHGGFKVVPIRIDPDVEISAARFLSETSIHVTDAEGVFARYGSRRIPATLIFDSQGVLVHSGGALDVEALRSLNTSLNTQKQSGL